MTWSEDHQWKWVFATDSFRAIGWKCARCGKSVEGGWECSGVPDPSGCRGNDRLVDAYAAMIDSELVCSE